MEELNFEIFEAEANDAAAIAKIQHEAWICVYPNAAHSVTRQDIEDMDLMSQERLSRWRQILGAKNPNQKIWVARDGGKAIAFAIARKGDDTNLIRVINVLPRYQGRGVGSRLMEQILKWLGADKPITLPVAVYNNRAIKFYKKFGFSESGKKGNSPIAHLPSGAVIPEIEMIKVPNLL